MELENSSGHKSHHRHHHHPNSTKEFRVVYAVEEPVQDFTYGDMRRTKSAEIVTREDVDYEAEEFIKFEHTKFTKWMTKTV